MGETTVNKLPFPTDLDAPDGPTQIKALADALDVLGWGSRNLKPTIGLVTATNLTLTESYVDLPSGKLEITPAVASKLLIVATFKAGITEGNPAGNVRVDGTLKLDAEADDTNTASFETLNLPATQSMQASVTQVYLYSLTAALHTIKMRGKKNSAKSCAMGTGSRMLYALFAS